MKRPRREVEFAPGPLAVRNETLGGSIGRRQHCSRVSGKFELMRPPRICSRVILHLSCHLLVLGLGAKRLAGLCGRDLKATDCRNTRADPDETGAPGSFRLRIRAQRDRQPLHDVCSARRLAPCQSHGSPHRCRLCSRLERVGRCPLRQSPNLLASYFTSFLSSSCARSRC